MNQLTRREWLWTAAVAALIVTISTVPYLVGYLAQTPQARFGGAVLNRPDYHSHLAKMWQGHRGQWRYRLLFTTEEHQGVYLLPFYIALGHLARLLGTSVPLTYQLARIVFGFAMLMVTYPFIAHFVDSLRTRRVAFLLATTASGLGWLTESIAPTSPGGISPIDFWLLSGYTYLAVLVFPHFCAATALLLTTFLLLLKRPEGPNPGEGALALAASLGLGIIHPYALLLADLLPVLYWSIRWIRTRRMAWRGLATVVAMGLAQIPLVAYDLWVFSTQSVFAGWSAQNITLSPPPRFYLLGYGPLLVLGAVGALAWVQRDDLRLTFPLLWVGLVAVLIYLPWNLQRRFLEGVQIPLGILAGAGLAEGLLPQCDHQETRWRWFALALLVALATTSHLLLTTGATVAALDHAPILFWSNDLVTGVDWLEEHTTWSETVLASSEVGGLIAGRIGHRVVIGHAMETVDYEGKREALSDFFAVSTTDAERTTLLEEWGVAYILYGPQERSLGDFDPSQAPRLEPAFHKGDVTVYRVELDE